MLNIEQFTDMIRDKVGFMAIMVRCDPWQAEPSRDLTNYPNAAQPLDNCYNYYSNVPPIHCGWLVVNHNDDALQQRRTRRLST